MDSAPVYLIEHGNTRLDEEGRVHGTIDQPLTQQGRAQAVQLGVRLKRLAAAGRAPAVLYASPTKRAQSTARIAGHIAGIPVRTAAALAGLDTGKFSGQPQARVAAMLKPYFRHPERPIPGGERVAAWRERHLGFMRRVARAAAAKGGIAGFVTHSNVIGSALAAARDHGRRQAGRGGELARTAMASPPAPAVAHRIDFPFRTQET